MKKKMSWWGILILSAVSYGLAYVIGGIIGAAFGILGLIFLASGIGGAISKLRAASKNRQ